MFGFSLKLLSLACHCHFAYFLLLNDLGLLHENSDEIQLHKPDPNGHRLLRNKWQSSNHSQQIFNGSFVQSKTKMGMKSFQLYQKIWLLVESWVASVWCILLRSWSMYLSVYMSRIWNEVQFYFCLWKSKETKCTESQKQCCSSFHSDIQYIWVKLDYWRRRNNLEIKRCPKTCKMLLCLLIYI